MKTELMKAQKTNVWNYTHWYKHVYINKQFAYMKKLPHFENYLTISCSLKETKSEIAVEYFILLVQLQIDGLIESRDYIIFEYWA